ncbi:uncharacterized protein N7459_003523 [Penicillium hispanicum]|uniref:uncharacterized protein n=1 Tax=Penicillium hispanicum TaxID=1080232 RepID=UPI0025404E2C|nr:uncharacterized protein N7459_003523 [Penicillium hispanicum]KAJ5587758.1 hypothetical protein N7459_003523 [Penicillium hispanicum]
MSRSRRDGIALAETNSQDGPATKRRKVRKGTQSCWECKRRKVRCIFASTANTTCDNCCRRNTACISQELPDELKPPDSGSQIETRLGRVEDLVEQLRKNASVTHILPSSTAGAPLETPSASPLPEDGGQPRPRTVSPRAPAAVRDFGIEFSFVICTDCAQNTAEDRSTCFSESSLMRTSPTIAIPKAPDEQAAGKHEEITRELIAAWPSQSDLDILYTLPAGPSAHLHREVYAPGLGPPLPREILQQPLPGSHPVLAARSLLILGTFLQGVLPCLIKSPLSDSVFYHKLMTRVVEKAVRLVTTNDELTGSIEGIECIMIEAMYQNHAGNLHLAWLALNRAISVAQMMGIDRGLSSPCLKFLEPKTRAAFDADHLCFRLVEMNCYLSVTLGLPAASLEARFATPEALEECGPTQRMQRIHCAVARLILRRNGTEMNDQSQFLEIEALLQKVAAVMPPQWWLIPNIQSSDKSDADILNDTIRLMDQLIHYHLLVRLHLPYILRSSPDGKYDHSKIISVSVSREILSRYIVFHSTNSSPYYCRGMDFLAFVAIAAMCMAYIDSHNQKFNSGSIYHFLTYSRPSDRGMMERTLGLIQATGRDTTDALASKLTRIINPLLAIEAKAAGGTVYSTSSFKSEEGELECDDNATNGEGALKIRIPYFGTISFERGAIRRSVPATSYQPGLGDPIQSAVDTLPADQETGSDYQLLSIMEKDPSTLNAENTQPTQPHGLVEESAVEHDWDLQGIDVALFDSLFRGAGSLDTVDEPAWVQWDGMA